MSDVVFINPPRSRRGVDHVLDTAMLWLASSLRQAGSRGQRPNAVGRRS